MDHISEGLVIYY